MGKPKGTLGGEEGAELLAVFVHENALLCLVHSRWKLSLTCSYNFFAGSPADSLELQSWQGLGSLNLIDVEPCCCALGRSRDAQRRVETGKADQTQADSSKGQRARS